MTFERRRRLLLGGLALLAPLPLPLNGVVGWAPLSAFWLLTALFLVRSERGGFDVLPIWAMNVLGLLYVPFLLIDLSSSWQGGVMRSLVHLILFALAVKLFSLRRDRDGWHAFLAVFFLFLAAVGTSVHPATVLYLGAFLVGGLWTVVRFTAFDVLAARGVAGEPAPAVPVGGFVGAATVLVSLGAVPLFVFLPRLEQPYLFGPGGAAGASAAGYVGRLHLDSIGTVRTGRAVVLRFAPEGPLPDAERLRFRAATFDEFTGETWRRRHRPTELLRRSGDGFFRLAEGTPRHWLEVWQGRAAGSNLPLPLATAALDVQVPVLSVDEAGIVSLPIPPTATFGYRVGLRRGAVAGETDVVRPIDLDARAVTPRMAALAREVMGDGEAVERVQRLERHLLREYRYTLDLGLVPTASPIERFLFDSRAGHCEYFATAMVLLLRAEGIPARLVSGYLGAELNPLEGYYIVRQTQAHAWVEAHLEERGWTTFDPTPPAGRPMPGDGGLFGLLAQTYDYLLFRWDRYVLTYGFFDQLGLLGRARELWLSLWDGGSSGVADEADAVGEQAASTPPGLPAWWLRAAMVVAVLLAALWLWRARTPWNATRAYRQLRTRWARRRPELEWLPPLEVERRITHRNPAAAPAARRLVGLYLEESFAGRTLTDAELADLRVAVRTLRRELRRAA